MKLLEFYILRRVGQMFLVALLPVLAIIWTTQVLARINLVTDSGQSIGSFIRLATFILPTIIPIVLPFALVIGISHTLASMNSDSELAVIDGAGASRSVIVRPILLLAAVLSVFSFFVDNVVEPRARVAVREMIAATYADLLSSVIEEKTFRRLEDNLYVQISERHSGRILKGLFVADSRDPNSELIYYAREGAVNETGTALVMKDGEVQRKVPGGNVSIVRFDSYAFDLSDLTETRGQANLKANDRGLGFLLDPDTTDANYQKNPGEYRAELHRRLTEWCFPLIFALFALVIAGDARSHREAGLHPMVSSLGIAFAIRLAAFYTSSQLEENTAYVVAVYTIPIASGCLGAYLLLRRKQLKNRTTVSSQIGQLWQTAVTRLRRKETAGGGN